MTPRISDIKSEGARRTVYRHEGRRTTSFAATRGWLFVVLAATRLHFPAAEVPAVITSRFAKNVGPMALQCASVYVIVGLGLSFVQNLRGLLTGGPSAFAWRGSLVDQGRLVWWWFVLPALAWPVDVYWTLYHASGW